MPVKNRIFRTVILLVAGLSMNSLSANGLELTPAQLLAERPNADGTATEVTVSVFVIDIDEINDVRQRFNVDVFLISSWQDPRLALPEEDRSGQVRTFPIDEIWTPRGLIVNDRGLSLQLPLVADVDAQGNVTQRQRLSGELAVKMDLREFPFDTQRLPIEINAYQ